MTDGPAPDWLRDQPEGWPVLSSEDVLRGGAPFAVRRDTVTRPEGGAPFDRIVVEHPGAVVVLAVEGPDERGPERALVLRQYRHAVGMRFVELPAGLLDAPGEDPLEAARRELREEAALEAADWVRLASIHNSPGFSSERIEIYLARGLEEVPDRGGFELEHEEADMTAHWVAVDELLAAVRAGDVTDGPVVIAVLTYCHEHRSGRRAG